jgi:hypothetical protein
MAGGFLVKGCRRLAGDGSEPGGAISSTVIPGPGMPGFKASLEDRMELYYRQFAVFNSAAYGVGQSNINIEGGNDVDKEIVNRFFNQYPAIEDFAAFCEKDTLCNGKYNTLLTNNQDPASNGIFKGALLLSGMHGGTAMVGELTRYATLRDQGYPEEMVEAARARVFKQLEVLDVANAIAGVPGVMAHHMRRKDEPQPWGGGVELPPEPPPPTEPHDHVWREDNTADQRYFDEWGWFDSCSKDQADGWLFAMGVAWDVIAEDPTIPQFYKDQLQSHARGFARMLMEVAPEFGTDMVIRDADGKLTEHCDVNPHVLALEACWSAGVSDEPVNTFNAIMGLGFIRVCLHIAGDEDIRDFYYKDLIGKRRWHEFVRDGVFPLSDMIYATNYSNVNMAFIAFYNAIRYESDPEVRLVLQQGMDRLWDNGKNNRQPKHINQTFFDVIYSGLRAGGAVPGEVAEGVRTLMGWPYPPPFWAEPVINCDLAELDLGECEAQNDPSYIIELPFKKDPGLYQTYETTDLCGQDMGLGHNSDVVAEYVIPRRLRGPSNNDWRSNPFSVNRCGNPYTVEAVPDIIAAYWLGRYLNGGTDPGRNLSPVARVPVAPGVPAGLAAIPVSEAQIDLSWTDTGYLEDGFIIERREASAEAFSQMALLPADATAFSDSGLSPLTTYVYRVVAYNDVGLSDPSNQAPATTFPAPKGPPAAASNLTADALDYRSVKLAWADNSNDEAGFRVMRDGVTVIETLAGDTGHIDVGLDDDTTYNYQVFAFNSAGDAAGSNVVPATTDKLPSILAYDPTAGQPKVPINIGHVQVQFGDPIPESQVSIEVSDEVGPINGTWSLDGTSTMLTFEPDPFLLTMSTQYGVSVSAGAASYNYDFFTEGISWTVDIDTAANRAFGMDIFRANLVEPAGLEGLLTSLGFEVFLLIGVLDADSIAQEMSFIGALGDIEGPDPTQQDKSSPTILFPQAADLSGNPEYVLGPFDLPISIQGFEIELLNVVLSGFFSENYEFSGNGEFQGDLDMGVIADLAQLDPEDLCALIGGCISCIHDPDRQECVHLYVTDIRADELPTPVEPIAAVVQKDLGGSDTVHTIELTLTHPETGLPETGIDLRIEIKDPASDDGLLNGDSVAYVTTDVNGKATVTLEDTSGGTNDLEAFIESTVLYTWVKSWMQAIF